MIHFPKKRSNQIGLVNVIVPRVLITKKKKHISAIEIDVNHYLIIRLHQNHHIIALIHRFFLFF